MLYALGYLTGIVTSVLILLAVAHFRPAIERTLNQTASRIKKKGEIIEPENEDFQNWRDELPNE